MKKDKFTFVERLILIIVLLAALLLVSVIALLVLCFNKANMVWQGKLVLSVGAALLFSAIAILFKNWIVLPYRDYKKIFARFVSGRIYEEMVDKAGHIIPGMKAVLLRYDKLLNTKNLQEERKKQSEYLALQNQINPHFLYNTLEAIRGDALCAEMDNIADITEALSTFFRYTITDTGSLVTLADEMDNVDNYFRIQKYRFGEKLDIEYEIPDSETDVLLLQCPKLTIQPIIENAIFHGLEKKSEGGMIRIGITLLSNKVLITIKDNGVGIEEEALDRINKKLERITMAYLPEEKNRKGGIALNNVCRRIRLLFGEEYGVHVYSLPGVGTDVHITLPILKKERETWNEGRVNSY